MESRERSSRCVRSTSVVQLFDWLRPTAETRGPGKVQYENVELVKRPPSEDEPNGASVVMNRSHSGFAMTLVAKKSGTKSFMGRTSG